MPLDKPSGDCVIGVISDTHGLLRSEAVAQLQGCQLIVHAGDIGNPKILEELRRSTPLVAVRGNCDAGPWVAALRETEVVDIAGVSLFVCCMI